MFLSSHMFSAHVAATTADSHADSRGARHPAASPPPPEPPAPPNAPQPPAPPQPPPPFAPYPPSPPPPPTRYEAALSSFRSSGYAVYPSFFTLLWQPSGPNLLLEIPSDWHGRLVVLNAEITASDSYEFILHQPAGTSYWWAEPRGDNTTLDILQPLLETSRVGPRSTMGGAAGEGALAPLRLSSLRAWDFGSNGVPQYSIPRERPDGALARIFSPLPIAFLKPVSTLRRHNGADVLLLPQQVLQRLPRRPDQLGAGVEPQRKHRLPSADAGAIQTPFTVRTDRETRFRE